MHLFFCRVFRQKRSYIMSRENRSTTLLNRKNNPSGNLAEKNLSKLIDFFLFQCYIDPVTEINNQKGYPEFRPEFFDLKILQHKKGLPNKLPPRCKSLPTMNILCRVYAIYTVHFCVVFVGRCGRRVGRAIGNAPLFLGAFPTERRLTQ